MDRHLRITSLYRGGQGGAPTPQSPIPSSAGRQSHFSLNFCDPARLHRLPSLASYALGDLFVCRHVNSPNSTAITPLHKSVNYNNTRSAPFSSPALAKIPRVRAQSMRPIPRGTHRCSPFGHPSRPAARPRPSQAVLLPVSVSLPLPWLLAKPCSYHRWSDGNASSSLSHRRRPAPARRRGVLLTSCRSRRGPAGHRAGSPCPGSRGRVSRPCGHHAGQTSLLMIRLCHSRACRRTDEYRRGFGYVARRAVKWINSVQAPSALSSQPSSARTSDIRRGNASFHGILLHVQLTNYAGQQMPHQAASAGYASLMSGRLRAISFL